MCQSSNLTIRKANVDNNNSPYGLIQFAVWVSVACACMLYGQYANAAGGCGSVCLPLEALDLDKAQVPDNNYRISLITEHAKFDNFREGDSSVTNTGGNKATITQTILQGDYGMTSREQKRGQIYLFSEMRLKNKISPLFYTTYRRPGSNPRSRGRKKLKGAVPFVVIKNIKRVLTPIFASRLNSSMPRNIKLSMQHEQVSLNIPSCSITARGDIQLSAMTVRMNMSNSLIT